jgi:hypothetical protein
MPPANFGTPLYDYSRFGESSSEFFYYPHASEADYKHAFNQARQWCLESPDNSAVTAAKIYHVKQEALKKSVTRENKKKRNTQGLYNTYRGNNKILNPAQEEAIRQYCYEQWEAGLGASHKMVQAAIAQLKAVRSVIYTITRD